MRHPILPLPVSSNAKTLALDFLAGRRLTVEELRQRLKRRGVDDVECEEVLKDLIKVGLLDDRAYAQDMLAEALEHGKHGPLGVRARLYRRKVAPEFIDEVLGQETNDWQAIALRVAQEYDIMDERARQRLGRRLFREGFSSDVIRRAFGSGDRSDGT